MATSTGRCKANNSPFDCSIEIDTDEQTMYEVRFLTEHGLPDQEVTDIVKLPWPNNYACNDNDLQKDIEES